MNGWVSDIQSRVLGTREHVTHQGEGRREGGREGGRGGEGEMLSDLMQVIVVPIMEMTAGEGEVHYIIL